MSETVTFKLNQIRRDGGTQPRALINQTVVAEYAEDMKRGDNLGPVKVYYDGTDYWLADGFHRMAACEIAGISTVEAEVFPGTRRDAILEAIRSNRTHGLRFTNADKRRAVGQLLADAEWSQWSDREIARMCGVTHPFVGEIRKSLVTVTSEKSDRKSHDGRTINTANIGQKPAAAPPPASNDHSLNPDHWYGYDLLNHQVITPGYLSQIAAQRQYPDRGRFTVAKASFYHQHGNYRIVTYAEWAKAERSTIKDDPLISALRDQPGNTTVEVVGGVKRSVALIVDDVMQVLVDGSWFTSDSARKAFPDGRRFALLASLALPESLYADWPVLTPDEWDEREQARDGQREEAAPAIEDLSNEEVDDALDEILGRPEDEEDDLQGGVPDAAGLVSDEEEPSNALEESDGIAIPVPPDWFLQCGPEQTDGVFEYLESLVDHIRENGFYELDAKDWHILHTAWLDIFESDSPEEEAQS